MEDKPYLEDLDRERRYRKFDENLDESELVWHRDAEDRLVYPINDTDWMFQFEDRLPRYMSLDEAIFIPKNTFHRVIKGSGELGVEIIEVLDTESSINEGRKKRKKKKKSKKKKKDDRCTRIAKRKYDTWPSAYASGAVVKCRRGKIWKDLSEEEIQEELEEASKTDYSKEKEKGLHGWFERRGGKGKSKGWVDCNTCRKDKKTGRKTCKSCGREKGEKRAKYPACRPTPSACGTKGKGKKWGKKSKKNENLEIRKVIQDILNELYK
jgi:hypothetical protein